MGDQSKQSEPEVGRTADEPRIPDSMAAEFFAKRRRYVRLGTELEAAKEEAAGLRKDMDEVLGEILTLIGDAESGVRQGTLFKAGEPQPEQDAGVAESEQLAVFILEHLREHPKLTAKLLKKAGLPSKLEVAEKGLADHAASALQAVLDQIEEAVDKLA